MENLLSKLNLYEIFRIILPGSYLTFLGYKTFQRTFVCYFCGFQWFVPVLFIIVSILLLDGLVYALDICKMFKNTIKYLPTNLMRVEYPSKYPKMKNRERMYDHEYYHWYENNDNKSKIKIELQSSLYHFALSFSFCAIVGIISCLFNHDRFIYLFNLVLLFLSLLIALLIVKRRLRHLWQRNYWEFRYEFIREAPENES